MKIHSLAMRAPKRWWTRPGDYCIADPEGKGGVFVGALVQLNRNHMVLPLWWGYRWIVHFNCRCKMLGLAAASPSVATTIPKTHVVFRQYSDRGDGWFIGGSLMTRIYRPEDYAATDLNIATTKHDRVHDKTVILADGRPVEEFIYMAGDESFRRTECKS